MFANYIFHHYNCAETHDSICPHMYYPHQPDPADIMIRQVNDGVFTYNPYVVGMESSDMVYGVYFGTTGKRQLFRISKKRIAQFCHVEHRIMWMVGRVD